MAAPPHDMWPRAWRNVDKAWGSGGLDPRGNPLFFPPPAPYPAPMFDIRAYALTDPQTLSLIAFHQSGMRSDSPEGKCYALDLTALAAPGITVWSAWAGERIAAIGALRRWPGEALGEIKSMRTHPDFLRQGAGARILDTIVTAARN